jgi:hypothetical protein
VTTAYVVGVRDSEGKESGRRAAAYQKEEAHQADGLVLVVHPVVVRTGVRVEDHEELLSQHSERAVSDREAGELRWRQEGKVCSDLIGANRTIRVWHGATENAPCTRDNAHNFAACVYPSARATVVSAGLGGRGDTAP